jgi:Putative auto-transporter adhesin, head GIN domain
MIRVLAMVAVAGFLVSAVTLSVAVAIAGPDAIVHGAWTWGPHGWLWRHHHHFDEGREDGPETTREISWPGGASLSVSVPAEVQYTQADGPAKVVISGPAREVEDVRLEDGRIRFDDDELHVGDKLKIAITAPAVTDFSLEGAESFSIAGYLQDRLSVSVSGFADVKAQGEVRDAKIRIAGAGHADLSALKTKAAEVEIDGSGDASVGPSDSADIDISGAGSVTLLSNPPQLHTNISGVGRIRHAGT